MLIAAYTGLCVFPPSIGPSRVLYDAHTPHQLILFFSHSEGGKADGALLEASAGYAGPDNVRLEETAELVGLNRQVGL